MAQDIIDVEAIEETPSRAVALLDYIPEIRRTPAEVKKAIEDVEGLVREHMRENIDYGKIPGTPKPSLYKAGAERIARFFGLGAVVEQTRAIEDWENGFVMYTYKVGIGPITQNGVVPIAWCEGSANNREKKYKNAAVYDIVNTIMKMSEKRAYVGAVLMATNTSDFFSQDLEDMPKELLTTPAAPKVTAKSSDPGEYIIDFGKFKETPTPLKDVPSSWVNFIIGKIDAREEAGDELSNRDRALKDAIYAYRGAQ